jgi:hypothetical protein
VVLAVAPGSVTDADKKLRRDAPWSRLLGLVDDRKWDIVRPDPEVSVTGEVATADIYASVAGAPERVVSPAAARSVEQRFAASLDRGKGRYPFDRSGVQLCRHGELGSPPDVALIMTEQAMVRFNRTAASAGQCGAGSGPHSLMAFYPADTSILDHPFVRLNWSDLAGRQTDAAAGFGRWLTGPDGKQALLDAGLRPPEVSLGDPLTEQFGVLPTVRVRHMPGVDTLAGARTTYAGARRYGRVLLALDASGSMDRPAAPGGITRFTVAAEGVRVAARLVGERDEFGLWVFPPAGKRGELVTIGRPVGRSTPAERARAAVDALRPVHPAGLTPLYRTIVDGVAALGGGDRTRVAALVVLTDGDDENASGLTPTQLVAGVADKNVRVFVIAVGEARCAAQALREVTGTTGGRCYDARFDTIGARFAELFGVLWGGGDER